MSEKLTIEQTSNNVTVIIDNSSPNILQYYKLLNSIQNNYEKFDVVSTNIVSNSAAYLNPEHKEMLSHIGLLSSNWEETFHEVNTVQNQLSANWEKTYQNMDMIVDGGTF
jgi:hypothetical protein